MQAFQTTGYDGVVEFVLNVSFFPLFSTRWLVIYTWLGYALMGIATIRELKLEEKFRAALTRVQRERGGFDARAEESDNLREEAHLLGRIVLRSRGDSDTSKDADATFGGGGGGGFVRTVNGPRDVERTSLLDIDDCAT